MLMMVALLQKPFEKHYIYTHTNLRKRYNKRRSQENWNAFTKQRHKFVKILRQVAFDYYKTLDIKCLKDNRKFWNTVKPIFSEKIQVSSKITLLGNGVLVTDDKEVSEIFNEYFANITDSVGIVQPEDALTPTGGLLRN